MHRVTLNLKSPQSKQETLILIYVSFNGNRIKVSTREKIHPTLWDFNRKSITRNQSKIERLKTYTIGENLNAVQLRLDNLISEVEKYFLKATVSSVDPSILELKDHLQRFLSPKKSTILFNEYVTDFLSVFIKEAELGIRKKVNGVSYKPASVVCYDNLRTVLIRFEKVRKERLKWKAINKTTYYHFIQWHEENGYSVNYCGRHVKDLKAIMRIAFEEKIHSNNAFRLRYFNVPKEVRKKIPLSTDEIEKMRGLDLTKEQSLSLSRDIFVLGCCVGLRVSDLKQISPDHVYEDQNGKFINIKTIKTGAEVVVPLNSIAINILKKYDFKLPYFAEQVVNRHLKILGNRIGLRKERASILSMHYSRCSFAKLAYELGIPSLYIMKITGHTSEQNFLRYINIAPQEAILEFRKHGFFQNNNEKTGSQSSD